MSAPCWALSYINTHTHVNNAHAARLCVGPIWPARVKLTLIWYTIYPTVPRPALSQPGRLGEMEDPHGACDTGALCFSPNDETRGGRPARCTLTGTGAMSGGLFFFIGSSGNHKANILLEDGFRGALWANWEGKWINEQPPGTVNQQAKRRAECTVEAPGAQSKARASVSQSLVLMSKPAGPGSTHL